MSPRMNFPLQQKLGQALKDLPILQNMLLASKCYFANIDGENIYKAYNLQFLQSRSFSFLSAHVHAAVI